MASQTKKNRQAIIWSLNTIGLYRLLWPSCSLYTKVAWRTTAKGAYVPLYFSPGDAFQFDWSEDYLMLDGQSNKLPIVLTKLSHSRAFILRAYPLQTHKILFDAHNHGFRVLGGVPECGIYGTLWLMIFILLTWCGIIPDG